MSINCRGVFLCYKYAAEAMVAQGRGGRIIGASSVVGKQGMYADTSVSLIPLSCSFEALGPLQLIRHPSLL